MEREARRKLKLCFINVLELANTHQQRYSRTAEITSTPNKKNSDLYALLVPISFKIYRIYIRKLPQELCLLDALLVPISFKLYQIYIRK